MIETHAASFEVNGQRLLHPLDLTFEEGRIHGLIGHNGSGKSTLLKLLSRQQVPSQGTIHLDGKPLASWGHRAFACRVAYLPQHLPATGSLTGRELVSLGRYPWNGLLGRHKHQDEVAIQRALDRTQTASFANRQVDTLSGGERQRIWLAMLLSQGSRFLLLDEPLSALDIAHQIDVLALIRDLSRELGLGVIIVLHDINMAARYCDHLVALHAGHLLAQGKPETIMNHETLKSIYGIPMHVMSHPSGNHRIAVAS